MLYFKIDLDQKNEDCNAVYLFIYLYTEMIQNNIKAAACL